ncbi:MAG: ice-binding family protein, partial [Solirubrobacterales bacterium]
PTPLVSGVYCFASSAQLTGTVTLDAAGDPNAVFIFKMGSTLTTASGSTVALTNGAQACNVYWQVGSSATLGTDTTFVGNVLALTSITAQTGTTVDGRLLARNGAVTLDNNRITRAECASDTGGGGGGGTGVVGGGTPTGSPSTGGGGGGGGGKGNGKDNGNGNSKNNGKNNGGGGNGGGGGNDDSLTTSVSHSAQDFPKSHPNQPKIPFTGLAIGSPALVGMLLLLLGVGLRKTRSRRGY